MIEVLAILVAGWILCRWIFPRPKSPTDWWDWYNAYLKSKEWKIKRRGMILRASGRCEICGLRKPLQVHHLAGSYSRIPNERPWDLAALCYDCHKEEHAGNRLLG
jgi:5-methylcytosine-specific restriction endonuclease McrA